MLVWVVAQLSITSNAKINIFKKYLFHTADPSGKISETLILTFDFPKLQIWMGL